MAKRDCYDVLGVTKSASKDEIKKAYRKLALKFHPDKTKGDKTSEEKFKEASEAYHILSDDKRKANYDQFGHAAFEGSGGGGQGFGGFDTSSFSDIFEDFFGDLYIRIITEVPVTLSKRQKELLEEFKKLEESKPNPVIKSFFEKAKKFWKNS